MRATQEAHVDDLVPTDRVVEVGRDEHEMGVDLRCRTIDVPVGPGQGHAVIVALDTDVDDSVLQTAVDDLRLGPGGDGEQQIAAPEPSFGW